MTPEKFKEDVQAAFLKAVANRNAWTSHTDNAGRIFDGVSVYGREAGVDLVETLIDKIFREALGAAEAKKNSLSLRLGKTGGTALAGMIDTLRRLTLLQVTESGGSITVTWAKGEPELL